MHLFSVMERGETAAGTAAAFPGKVFNFKQITRLQCSNCNGVMYRDNLANCIPNLNIPFDYSTDSDDTHVAWNECIDKYAGVEIVDLNCPKCGTTCQFVKSMRFGTFPKYLMVQMERFVCPDWVPTKLKCNVDVPIDTFSLAQFEDLRPEGEDILPDDSV